MVQRVARLMREAGLSARAASLYRANPGTHAFFTSVPNRMRKLKISAVDQVWVGDITYLRVASRWRYLAAVMDRYSRRLVGWYVGLHKDAKLTVCALNRALLRRHPPEGLIFHSDRGIEYAAFEFRTRLAAVGVAEHEPAGEADRQCAYGKLLPQPQVGCDTWSALPQRGAAARDDSALHPVLQSHPCALRTGLSFADHL